MIDEKIEIARSFSRKKNLGNYETMDFFCSAKQEVSMSSAQSTSKYLDTLCQQEVGKSIREFNQPEEIKKVKEFLAKIPGKTPAEYEAESRAEDKLTNA